MNNGVAIGNKCFVKDKSVLESLTKNASRLMESMRKHVIKRTDIEKLADALDYDAPQLETDIEDVISLASYGRYSVNKILQEVVK